MYLIIHNREVRAACGLTAFEKRGEGNGIRRYFTIMENETINDGKYDISVVR